MWFGRRTDSVSVMITSKKTNKKKNDFEIVVENGKEGLEELEIWEMDTGCRLVFSVGDCV